MATSIARFCHSNDVETEIKFAQKSEAAAYRFQRFNNNIALRLRTADQHLPSPGASIGAGALLTVPVTTVSHLWQTPVR